MPTLIHHLAPAGDYQSALPDQPFTPANFDADGFIHCTQDLDVLLEVANQFYSAQPGDFVVLDLDLQRLAAAVRFEDPSPPAAPGSAMAGVRFPHIYGPINRDAIVAVRPARRAADGRFLSV